MEELRPEATRKVVRDLVELLAPYEEELITIELTAPDVAYLRRAVSMAIAEACYWISDGSVGRAPLRPSKGDEAPPGG